MATKTFAFVVDSEVIGTLTIPDTAVNAERLWAGLSSNPTVVDATDAAGLQIGWIWDGESFSSPE
jgi:hypothetical protein